MQLWLSDPMPAESRLQARLKDREREVTGRIQQMHKDLTQAEVLREELRRDIALCERHSTQLGDQTLRKERGI
jgi:hypothetical protein